MKRNQRLFAAIIVLLLTIGATWFWRSSQQQPVAATAPSKPFPQVSSRQEPANAASDSGRKNAHADKSIAASTSWKPANEFAVIGTPAVPIIFPRGENGNRRFHNTLKSKVSPALRSRDAVILASSPADGRFQLTADETDVNTLRGARMVFNTASLDAVIDGKSARILAPSFGDEKVTFEIDTIITRDANSHTLQGHVVGEETTSNVQLVYHDGIVQGTSVRYTTGQEMEYRILSDGYMMVRELDHSTMTEDCGNDELTAAEPLTDGATQGHEQGPTPDEPLPQVAEDTIGLTSIDVVVGYDKAARAAQGGYPQIEALIIASVDRMNRAFVNSEIGGNEVVLIGTVEDPNYIFPGSSSGTQSDELDDLRYSNRANFSTVKNYASTLGADLISFVTKDGDGSAGLASRPGFVTVIARTYMTETRLVFAHELGHNLGCYHSWGDSSDDFGYRSAYGWRLAPPGLEKVRTIMAYDSATPLPKWGTGARIPYYSNPAVSFNEARTGAVNGYNVQGDATADQIYYSKNSTEGFNGLHAALGANNAAHINGTGTAPILAQAGAVYASNRATRTTFQVTSPSLAGRYARGSTMDIFFTGGDYQDTATIQLFKGGILQQTFLSNLNPAVKRGYAWAIPANFARGNDYMVRVVLDRNGSTLVADSPIFSIIENAPYILSQSPSATGDQKSAVTQFSVTYSKAMNPATFSVSDDILSFTGPSAVDLKPAITSAVWSVGNTVLTLNFNPLTPNGAYSVVIGSQISDTQGNLVDQDADDTSGEISDDSYTALFSIKSLADALNANNLVWATSVTPPWFVQSLKTHDGIQAAQSGKSSFSNISTLDTTISEAGYLTFWWKVSSLVNSDYLYLYDNDVEQTGDLAGISGEVDWTLKSILLPPGTHNLSWRYIKDASNIAGADSAYLDQVTFTPAPSLTLADDGLISEGSENGEVITITLTKDTFVPTLNPANWTLTNLPAGVSKGTLTRINDTTATLTLSGNRTTDYTLDIANLTVSLKAAEFTNWSQFDISAASGVIFHAYNAPPMVNAGIDQTVALVGNGPWTPAEITTQAWFDAADSSSITLASGNVSQWNDKSGNGRNISQATAGQRPSFASQTVSFDGVDDVLTRSGAFMYANGSMDIYVAGAIDSTAGDKRLISESNFTNNNPIYGAFQNRSNTDLSMISAYIRNDGNTACFANSNSLSPTGAFNLTTRKIYQVNDSGATLAGRVNGGSPTTVAYTRSGTMTLTSFGVGGIPPRPSSATGSAWMRADVNEIVIVPNLLGNPEREKMEGYLAHKWNLTASLPAMHPYKTAAPGGDNVSVALSGTASDPESQALTIVWSVVSGPSGASIVAPGSLSTTAQFGQIGVYVLRLTVSDGTASVSDDVTITVNPAPPALYTAWAGSTFAKPFVLTALDADPDGDGVKNLMEFATGTDPTTGTQGVLKADGTAHGAPIIIPSGAAGSFDFVFIRRDDHGSAGSVDYMPQFSSDLETFYDSAITPTVIADSAVDTDYEVVKVPYPTTLPNGKKASFGRLQVVEAP